MKAMITLKGTRSRPGIVGGGRSAGAAAVTGCTTAHADPIHHVCQVLSQFGCIIVIIVFIIFADVVSIVLLGNVVLVFHDLVLDQELIGSLCHGRSCPHNILTPVRGYRIYSLLLILLILPIGMAILARGFEDGEAVGSGFLDTWNGGGFVDDVDRGVDRRRLD